MRNPNLWWAGLVLLVLAWQLPGILGRDPWKPDEAYTVGLVLNILESGDCVVPTLGRDPFMEKPPVFFLTAAATARLFSPWLSLHVAARMATLLFNALTLLFLGLAGREANGRGHGWPAAVLLIGCAGPLHILHFLVTDVALLTGFAMALYGMLLALRRPVAGGVVLGTAAGLAFMAKGLLGPGLLGLAVLLLPAMCRCWRRHAYWRLLLGITPAVLPWVIIWPTALWMRSPELFRVWFWDNNFGRFLGSNAIGPEAEPLYFITLIPWYALPATPLALWALWKAGRRGWREPGIGTPLLLFLVTFAMLSVSRDAREIYALILLPPVFVLGARALDDVGPGWVRILRPLTAVWFSVSAAGMWLTWTAIQTGVPAWLTAKVEAELPGFAPTFSPVAFGVAACASAAWVVLVWGTGPGPRGLLVRWAGGLCLGYLLGMTLFLPLAEHHMSYRAFVQLKSYLTAEDTVASENLGEPQRAMLHYYAGIKTWRKRSHGRVRSEWFLMQHRLPRDAAPPEPARREWTPVWTLRHGKEFFVLYHVDT